MNEAVPQHGEIPSGVFELPMLRVDHNGNNIVDDDDYFIAYVSGANDWEYNAAANRFDYRIHRYDDFRTYWLAIKNDAATLPAFDAPNVNNNGAATLQTFEDNVFLRRPTFILQSNDEGGIDWGMTRFTTSRADTAMTVNLRGLDPARSGSLRILSGTIRNAAGTSSIGINLNGRDICAQCGGNFSAITNWGENHLTSSMAIRYTSTVPDARSFHELNAVHLRYPRRLELSDDAGRLEIFSSGNDVPVRYGLDKQSDERAYIIRIPTDERAMSLVGIVNNNQTQFEWTDNGGQGIRYIAALANSVVDYSDSLEIVPPRQVINHTYQIRDLRNVSNRTDYLIIAHADFLQAAINLAEHKQNINFSHPRVVLVNDILDQFGGGNVDPSAIRNFLLHVYRHWDGGGDFSYVVLFGAGHYDHKRVVTNAPVFIPVPYINSHISDDFYTFFDPSRPPANQHNGYYFIGRIPAKSAAAARDMVDKIIEIEDGRFADFGPWRNRVLFSADDDQQGPNRDQITNHHIASRIGSDIIERERPEIDLRKHYLYEFEWDAHYRKPGAARAFTNEINSGVALVNWFGHGALDQFADEAFFRTPDVGTLRNRGRYPVFTLFSCSMGKFDQPHVESIAELLVRQPRAGAIAVVSAAREVFATRNERLAAPFFNALFGDPSGASPSIGGALRTAKLLFHDPHNRFFIILGDPSIRYFNRGRDVLLSIVDADGNPVDTLKALQRVTVSGSVLNEYGQTDESFGGAGASAFVTLFNPPQFHVRRKDGGTFTSPAYDLPGAPVFSGAVNVANGRFEQQLLLPMNLSFRREGVKLTAYVWNEGTSDAGAGFLGGLIFDGSELGGGGDTLGPRISVRPVYGGAPLGEGGVFVRNRVTAQLPLTVEILVEDESGINLFGDGPDEGLTAEVRGALSRRSISHQFQFTEGSFSRGTATLSFPENSIRSGAHELIISAQDLLGNVSRHTVALEISDPGELRLDHVTNIPNPVRMGRETQFFYHHSDAPGDLGVRVTIRVYTLGGRLIAVMNDVPNGHRWRPTDQHGNLLTPNVYLYQISATSTGLGGTTTSRVKKLVVHPPGRGR